ncbi:MAG: D-alanyl-D-alanine carboxypeptidase family protein [Solirubrobacteraceae bacterium]
MLTAGRKRRRSTPGPVGILAALFGVGIAVIAVAFGLLRAEPSESVARPAVERPPPPAIERPPVQEAVGPLPEPPGASRVDLSQPALLADLKLRPAPKAGLAFDFADGSVLWRRGATRVRPIASLTKLMTGLLAVESFSSQSRVRLTAEPDRIRGSHMGGLRAGRSVRAEVLLRGLMISSGNDAAVALAVGGAGSVRAWVRRMNRRAELLGLTCTHFVDPHGLDARNRSCPADIAALAIRAMAEPRLARIARRRSARVWPGFGKKLTLRTTNHLLRDRYPGAIGLKTGFTYRAGHCLVAVIERGGRRIGIVLLGSDTDAFADARRIASAAERAGAIDAATSPRPQLAR